jgi:hypothetical protein
MLMLFLAAIGPAAGQTVSLLNGAELSMQGLNLTVANCSLVLAGWQQASCASGGLALQAIGGSPGTVGYQLAYNGNGSNGINNTALVGGDDLFQVSFTLAVATNETGSTVSAATLTTTGAGTNCAPFCGADIIASQRFSAAAGGGDLAVNLLSSPTASLILTNASAFTINEIVSMNPPNSWEDDCWDPSTLNLGSVRQTFKTVAEPATVALLLTGIGGLALARSRRRRANRPRL